MIQLLKKRSMITEEVEATAFVNKFPTFFEEFKDQATSNRIFYLIYILRRNILVACIVFISDGIIQLIVSLVCCLSVNLYLDFCLCYLCISIQNNNCEYISFG